MVFGCTGSAIILHTGLSVTKNGHSFLQSFSVGGGVGWGRGDSVAVKLSKFNFDILEFHSSYKAKLYLVNVILILENG